jgi:hypothetical protein
MFSDHLDRISLHPTMQKGRRGLEQKLSIVGTDVQDLLAAEVTLRVLSITTAYGLA